MEIRAKDCKKKVTYYLTGAWYGYMNAPVKLIKKLKSKSSNKTYQEFIFTNGENDFSVLPDDILFTEKFIKEDPYDD